MEIFKSLFCSFLASQVLSFGAAIKTESVDLEYEFSLCGFPALW